jgi:bis(5'-nucleosyl)-tetraphosphatase (symmetrical)
MSTYVIGSVFGNFNALTQLLRLVAFEPQQDRLWFTGNLVGSGGESLAALRFVKGLGKSATTILGDQELQLLSVAVGLHDANGGNDWQAIIDAEDGAELLQWLRRRSLLHHDSKLGYSMVHAGIPSEWTFSQTLTFAYEVESTLSGPNCQAFLENRQQDQSRWHAKLRGWKRVNFITNALTAMRYCNEQGKLDFNANGSVKAQADALVPWYRVPERQTANLRIVFADDYGFDDDPYPGIYPIAGGERLSALALSEEPGYFSVKSSAPFPE